MWFRMKASAQSEPMGSTVPSTEALTPAPGAQLPVSVEPEPATSASAPEAGGAASEPAPKAPAADAGTDNSRARVQATGAAPGSAAESTLRVDVVLLNRMMNLVGELVLTRNQVLQATAADPNMTLLSRRLDMVTADLRENVMKARMQPVSNIFSKMPRIVRDLSQSLGRRVRLQVEGQDTELDKSLLEAIKDPLTHAVRNSLDHGIEPPEVRQAAGKDPEGTLKLRASHEGTDLLPKLIEARRFVRRLRFWSAASSTGQEGYSLAMLLREHFPMLVGWDLRIEGTDLSTEVVERAQGGLYHRIEINRGLPARFVVRYFDHVGEDRVVKPEVRKLCNFRQANLCGPALPFNRDPHRGIARFDLIFLRNVMLYFSQETRKTLLASIHRLLAPDGILFLGSSEQPADPSIWATTLAGGTCYFKPRQPS